MWARSEDEPSSRAVQNQAQGQLRLTSLSVHRKSFICHFQDAIEPCFGVLLDEVLREHTRF